MCDKTILNECINSEGDVIKKISKDAGISQELMKRTLRKSLTLVIESSEKHLDSLVKRDGKNNWISRIVQKYVSEINYGTDCR